MMPGVELLHLVVAEPEALGGFVLDAVAPGVHPREVIALTEMDVAVAANVRTME